MTTALEKLLNNDILDGFDDTVERTLYISGKDWKRRLEEGKPMKVIGFYKNTYFKEFNGTNKANHVILTPKGDVVINGYGDLNAKFEKIPRGSCVMVEFIGEVPATPMPKLIFEVRRNKSKDMSPEEVASMLEEVRAQEESFKLTAKPAQKSLAPKNDFPF